MPWGPWVDAARFAVSLEKAGFSPSIVSDVADVPPTTPLVENYSPAGGCARNPLLPRLLSLVTLWVIPQVDCSGFGHQFDLRRSTESPAQRIDTHFEVPVVIGWLVGPLLLLPDFSDVSPEQFYEHERRLLRAAMLNALQLQ
jgi:hypothetical protein